MTVGLFYPAIGEACTLAMICLGVRNRSWRRTPLAMVLVCQLAALFAAALVFHSRPPIAAPAEVLGWVLMMMAMVTSLRVERDSAMSPREARLWRWLSLLFMGAFFLMWLAGIGPTAPTGWNEIWWAFAIEGLTLFAYFSLRPGGPG